MKQYRYKEYGGNGEYKQGYRKKYKKKDGTVLQKNHISVEKLSEINPFNLITQDYFYHISSSLQSRLPRLPCIFFFHA